MTRSRSTAALVLSVVLPLSLAACGDRAEDHAGHDASDSSSPSESATPSETPSETPGESGSEAPVQQSGPVPVTGDAGVEQAVVVSGSEVGGDVSPLAFPLETPQERQDFTAAFEPAFAQEVTRAVESLDAPAGTMAWGTVAEVGCQGPESVRIDAGEAGFQVTPDLPKSTVQCLVPVTYVVVFGAPTA